MHMNIFFVLRIRPQPFKKNVAGPSLFLSFSPLPICKSPLTVVLLLFLENKIVYMKNRANSKRPYCEREGGKGRAGCEEPGRRKDGR